MTVLASLVMGAALWLVAGPLDPWFAGSQGVLVRLTALPPWSARDLPST